MTFELIALTVLLGGWALCGVVPWVVLSVATRGNAGLAILPVSVGLAILFALLVPVLGGTGITGLRLSFVVALVAPGVFLAARSVSAGARAQVRPRRKSTVHVDRSESP